MNKSNEEINVNEQLWIEESYRQKLELEKDFNHMLRAMAMRVILNSYSLPGELAIIAHELKGIYSSMVETYILYKSAIKQCEYTDLILQNRKLADELNNNFMEVARNLYDTILKLGEPPLCIRENFIMLQAVSEKLKHLEESDKI